MLNIFPDFKNTGVNSNIIEVDSGINVPEKVTAVFYKKQKKLYVLDVLEFDKMFYLNEAKKEKAATNLQKFKSGLWKIGSEKWAVEFADFTELSELALAKSRTVNRLSNYDNDSKYRIKQIKEAVHQLEGNKQIEFDSSRKTIMVNSNNYMTFIGVIHNGIVKRLISGDVEVVN